MELNPFILQNNQVVETLAAESGLPIELLATHFQDSTTIIGRLRNILLQKAQNNGFSLAGIDFKKIIGDRASSRVDKEAKEIEEAISEDKYITLFKTKAFFTGNKT